MNYIIYKKKVAGPIPQDKLDHYMTIWKQMVDDGALVNLPDSEISSETIEKFPNEVHLIRSMAKP